MAQQDDSMINPMFHEVAASDEDTNSNGYSTEPDIDESGDDSETEVPALAHDERKLILVTGGAGFIGSHVAAALLARGDDVVIVDEVNDYYDTRIKRRNLAGLVARFGSDRCTVYEGDICNAPFMTEVFERHRPQWICHLAARAGVRPSIDDPFIYIHSNIEGTTRLLELARQYGCRNFAYASSSSVYGGSDKKVFRESDVVDFPVSPYAASKKSCELIAHTYHHLYGINVSGLRFFTVYGPRGRPDMAPFKFIERISRGQPVMQFGDGSTSRDYTYIDDIVDGVVRALDRPLGYQVFNLGNGSPVRLSHFISLVEESVGKKAAIKLLPDQPGDVPRTCADVSKARRLLGYNPTVPFDEGIRRTVEWYQQEYMGGAAAAAEGSEGAKEKEENPECPLTRCPSAMFQQLPVC